MSDSQPTLEPSVVDPEKQKQAKQYARIRRYLMLVDLALGAAYVLAWLLIGWSSALKQGLLNLTTNEWLLVLLYGFVFGAFYFLIGLPLSFYSGYRMPHRFGQSNQSLKDWVVDQVKGLLVGGVMGALLLEAIYAVLRAAPELWWLWAAAMLLFFNVVLSILAPVLLMPIFYKFNPLGQEHAELAERLTRLAERAQTRVQGVFKFDMSRRTKAANAALTGLGSTRRILLADTLINEFSTDEIETVLAHELGHHVNRDIPLMIAVNSLSTLLGLYLASLALQWGIDFFGFDGPADIAALPLFLLVMAVYGLLTMPLSNAFSRWRERLADEYALKATGNGRAYASALARLSNQNLADADPQPWVEWLLYSHPALGRRIRMAQAWPQPAPKP